MDIALFEDVVVVEKVLEQWERWWSGLMPAYHPDQHLVVSKDSTGKPQGSVHTLAESQLQSMLFIGTNLKPLVIPKRDAESCISSHICD